MTRFRSAPLGRALIGLAIGAVLFLAHGRGVFRDLDMAALEAVSSWRMPSTSREAVVLVATSCAEHGGHSHASFVAVKTAALRNVLGAGATAVGLDEPFLDTAGVPDGEALLRAAADRRCVVALGPSGAASPEGLPPALRSLRLSALERFGRAGGSVWRVWHPGRTREGGTPGFLATLAERAAATTPPSTFPGAMRANLRRLESPRGLLVDSALPSSAVRAVSLDSLAFGTPEQLRTLVAGCVVLLSGADCPSRLAPSSSFLTAGDPQAPVSGPPAVPWALATILASPGVREVPEELYGSLLVLLAVMLTLGLGGRGLAWKLSTGLAVGVGAAVLSVASLFLVRTLMAPGAVLATVATCLAAAVWLELAEAAYVIERELRTQPRLPGGSGDEPEGLSSTSQVEETLKSIVGWHDLPAAALLFAGPLRPARVAVAVGDGPVHWQRAPALRALATRALEAKAPVLGRWPSGGAEGDAWHALAVPVTGWAGQAAALVLAGTRLPIPEDALDFGVRAVRQLLAARTLAFEVNLSGDASRVKPSALPLPRRMALLWSAHLGRQRQAALAAAWRSAANEAVVLFDLGGRPALWNRRAETLFNGEASGLPQAHLVNLLATASGLPPQQIREAATDALLHGTPFVCDLEDPTGRYNYVATLSQVAVGGEAPGGLVLRAVDVTGVCRPARVEARLMSVAAHEMRTPLTSIMGYAELLVDNVERATPPHRYAAAIHRQAQRLEAIVEELLAVTRLEAGRDELTLEPVDMTLVAHHVVAAAQPMAKDHGVTVTTHGEPGRTIVRGDALKLERVVENLVSNAVKYSGPGASVVVTARRAGDRVLTAVADNGRGIPGEDAAHIFEKFYRGRSEPTDAVPGTGLGLSIVKLVVEAHGGETVLRTALGEGSTFTVSLPVGGPDRDAAFTAA